MYLENSIQEHHKHVSLIQLRHTGWWYKSITNSSHNKLRHWLCSEVAELALGKHLNQANTRPLLFRKQLVRRQRCYHTFDVRPEPTLTSAKPSRARTSCTGLPPAPPQNTSMLSSATLTQHRQGFSRAPFFKTPGKARSARSWGCTDSTRGVTQSTTPLGSIHGGTAQRREVRPLPAGRSAAHVPHWQAPQGDSSSQPRGKGEQTQAITGVLKGIKKERGERKPGQSVLPDNTETHCATHPSVKFADNGRCRWPWLGYRAAPLPPPDSAATPHRAPPDDEKITNKTRGSRPRGGTALSSFPARGEGRAPRPAEPHGRTPYPPPAAPSRIGPPLRGAPPGARRAQRRRHRPAHVGPRPAAPRWWARAAPAPHRRRRLPPPQSGDGHAWRCPPRRDKGPRSPARLPPPRSARGSAPAPRPHVPGSPRPPARCGSRGTPPASCSPPGRTSASGSA